MSSYSDGANNCVEVAFADQVVGLWDSKHVGQGPIEITFASWQQFVNVVKQS